MQKYSCNDILVKPGDGLTTNVNGIGSLEENED